VRARGRAGRRTGRRRGRRRARVHRARGGGGAGTRSTVWYCPGFPARDGTAPTVSLTNLGTASDRVDLTVLVDGQEPAREQVTVPASSVVRWDVPGPAAVLVETYSEHVVVEEALTGAGVFAVGPCASNASGRWYFATGSTERGVEDVLLLLNPFDEDAVVDVTLFTNSGVQRPDTLRALDVPARSRLVLPVHAAALREPVVAMSVSARAEGRVVAAQVVAFNEESGRRGVTRTLGAVATATRWQIAEGRADAGTRRVIGVLNPGDVDSEVDVQVVPVDPEIVVDPITVTVGRAGTVAVEVGTCGEQPAPTCVPVPDDVEYSVLVTATVEVPVVVQDLTTFAGRVVGASSSVATREPATSWLFGRSQFGGQRASYLAVVNPGSEPATVSVSLVVDGERVAPPELQDVALPPGRRVRLPLAALSLPDGGVELVAGAPVVAERVSWKRDSYTRSAGIPVRSS
jgi:hypothetical protein